jgi:hypothetical protein
VIIDPNSLREGCPSRPNISEPVVSAQGRQACYTADAMSFSTGSQLYQIDIAAPGELPVAADKTFLLSVLNSLRTLP